MYSEIQNKVIDQLDRATDIRSIEDFTKQRDANSPEETVVEITTFDGDEFYFRYNVWPDGETELHRFKLEESKLIQYDERFSMFRDKEKTSGDEPFDVVVKNEIEKENKTMAKCDFQKIAQEVNEELFKQWVEDNADDLVEYAEDSFREAYAAYIEDNNGDYETMAHEAIDNIIDNLWMSDYSTDLDDDPEEVISAVIM